jgi:hypothetical protein
MNTSEEKINKKIMEFPSKVKELSKEECAKILRKALSTSEKYKTQTDIAKLTKINEKSIGDYFTARHKPPQEKWNILRKVLFEGIEKKVIEISISEAIHSAERIKAIIFLLKDELEYFKESKPEVREILKKHLPGHNIGYIASLLSALYDENQLEIFKKFVKE